MGTQEAPKNAFSTWLLQPVGIPGAPSQPPTQPEMQAAYSHLYKGTSIPLGSVAITPSSDPPFGTVFTIWISLDLPKIFADCRLAPSAVISAPFLLRHSPMVVLSYSMSPTCRGAVTLDFTGA